MPKSSSDASHKERKTLGESSREKKAVPHHHKKKSGNVEGNDEAAVQCRTSSHGKSDPDGARRSERVRYDTETVRYVSGGVQKKVLLKVPVLQLDRLDIFATEIRAMARSQLPRNSDSKEKGRNVTPKGTKPTPTGTKPKVSAVSETKHIPVRVTRKNSPPQPKAGLASNKPDKKISPKQKNKLQFLKKVEIYDDVSDVPLEEYCDAESGAECVQAETETGATKNKLCESQHKKRKGTGEGKPAQAPHKKHKGEPLETGTAEGNRSQPPHKKHKSAPLEDYEDISDTPLDEYTPPEKPSQSATVINDTERKILKARDKTTGLKLGDSTSKGVASNSKVSPNKAEKKGPQEAHSSVRTSATDVQPSQAKSNITSTKQASKPSPALASAKNAFEKTAVKRPGTPCRDHGAKKLRSDADAAKDKIESEASVSRRSNSSPSLTKKAPPNKPTSKSPPCASNAAATCGLKETPATKLKAGATETKEKAKTVASSVQQKTCSTAMGKAEQDNAGKKPVPCGESICDKPNSTLGTSRNIPASSSITTAGEVTKVKHSSEGAHESTTSPVAKKVSPSKQEKKQAPSTKDSSGITASKPSCSGEPTKDLPTAKTVKSATEAKAKQSVNGKTLPTSILKKSTGAPAAPKGTPGVAKSSGQSVSAKAPLSTAKPFNDTAKVKPANESGKMKTLNESGTAMAADNAGKVKPVNNSAKVKPGTCVNSPVAKQALSSKPAKIPASCAKDTSEMPVTATAKALIPSVPEKQISETSPRTVKRPQPDLKTEHLKPAKQSAVVSKKSAVENVNVCGRKEKKPNEIVVPVKDTPKSKPPTCSASGIEVKISRSKLPSSQKLPKCSSSSQIPTAATESLSGASKSEGNEQQGTCEALASEAEQVPKEKKAQLTECTESSVSVHERNKTILLSSASERLCETETQEHHPSNIVEATAVEVRGQMSSFQSTTTCKGAPEATEVPTERAAPTTDCVSKEPPSDIVDTVSEAAPCTIDSQQKDKRAAPTTDCVSKEPPSDIVDTVSEAAPCTIDSRQKDISYLHKPCTSTVQVPTEGQEQSTTGVPHALDVEADVDGSTEDMDIGSEVEHQNTCLNNGPTIHQEDGQKQQDANEAAGQSREHMAFNATPDAICPGESTVASKCDPSGRPDGNASQMAHNVGDTQEEGDNDSSSIITSCTHLQEGFPQAECSTELSTREDAKPPANTEVSQGAVSVASLPEKSSAKNVQDDHSAVLSKNTSDALVKTVCSEDNDMLLQGSSPSGSSGDMLAGTTHSNSQMPSVVSHGDPQNLDLSKASSQDPATDCFSPDKQGANTCTLQASHNSFQQINQKKIDLLQKPLCDIKIVREMCGNSPLKVGEGNVSKSEETTIGALLKELIEAASSDAKDDLCNTAAMGSSYQEPVQSESSSMLPPQDNAAKYLTPGPTGELDDSETSTDICQPAADEVFQRQAEDSPALSEEKEGTRNASSELPQRLHSEDADAKVNTKKSDSLAGCESGDQVQAKEPSAASPSKTHSGLPLFKPSADTMLSDGSSGGQQQEEALKNGPAEEARGIINVAASLLRLDTGDENSVGGSDILASKSSSRKEEATFAQQHHSESPLNAGPSCGDTEPSHCSDAPSPGIISPMQTTDNHETGSTQMDSCLESAEEMENVPEPDGMVVSGQDDEMLQQSPPINKKEPKCPATNTSLRSAWLFSGKEKATNQSPMKQQDREKQQLCKDSSESASLPVVEAAVANSDKAADSELDDGGSMRKRLPRAATAEVEATSDQVTLRGIDGKPTSDAIQGVEASKSHAAAPCAKSSGSPLHSALLDLDMYTGLSILDICGSRTEKLDSLKTRIKSHSITKNEAVTEIAQSVHSAVVEEYFKRERAVRALNLLARIPFSLDPHEVRKIRNITQSIVDQSQVCVPKTNCEGR